MMTNTPEIPVLQEGDKIAITCPAKTLRKPLNEAIKLLEKWGLEVVTGETVNATFHQFSGTDELRARDMQRFIDDPSIKAIIAARGGYGCIRIVDLIDFSKLKEQPKWIIGFSDITVFHSQLQRMGIPSIHAQMPSTIENSSSEGLHSLKNALWGRGNQYEFETHYLNKPGEAQARVVGGNLSLLTAVLGSKSDFNYEGKILFLEEVGEYLYTIDRMIRTLDRAGKFKNLQGLMIGGFTELKDNDIPFGFSAQEIIHEVVRKYDFPVCYNFPAGHMDDNRALVLGRKAVLQIGTDQVEFRQ